MSSDSGIVVRIDCRVPYKSAKRAMVTDFDRIYLTDLKKQHGGNISAMARAAKLSRRHLREMLKNYGLWDATDPFGGFDAKACS